jgi:hypothetical protein
MTSMCALCSVPHQLKWCHITVNWNFGLNSRIWKNQETKIADLRIEDPNPGIDNKKNGRIKIAILSIFMLIHKSSLIKIISL